MSKRKKRVCSACCAAECGNVEAAPQQRRAEATQAIRQRCRGRFMPATHGALRYAISNAPELGQSEALTGDLDTFSEPLARVRRGPSSGVVRALGADAIAAPASASERCASSRHVLTPLMPADRSTSRASGPAISLGTLHPNRNTTATASSCTIWSLAASTVIQSARTIRLLEEVLYERGVTLHTELMCSLVEFVKATPDLRRAAGLVSTLAEHGGPWVCGRRDSRALSVADETPRKLPRSCAILDDDSDIGRNRSTLLGSRIRDDRLRGIVERHHPGPGTRNRCFAWQRVRSSSWTSGSACLECRSRHVHGVGGPLPGPAAGSSATTESRYGGRSHDRRRSSFERLPRGIEVATGNRRDARKIDANRRRQVPPPSRKPVSTTWRNALERRRPLRHSEWRTWQNASGAAWTTTLSPVTRGTATTSRRSS